MAVVVYVVLGAALVALLGVLLSLRVVKQYEEGVLFRLGRVVGVKRPGLNRIVPLIDVLRRVSLRIVTMPIQSQGIITRDNVSVDVSAVAYYKVVDATKSVVAIENVAAAIDQIAQTTLRKVVGQHTLDETLAETDRINVNIREILDVATEDWGVVVTLVELKDIQLPDSMKRAMARQAEAEREKRAKIIAAEGESLAAAALGEASDIMMAHPLALQLRNLQSLVEIGVDKNTTVVFPAPLMSTIQELGAFLARETTAAGAVSGMAAVGARPQTKRNGTRPPTGRDRDRLLRGHHPDLGDALDAPALSVDRLTKSFGPRTAYSEVSFDVAHGEVFGFLGPNGAGKTTTVRTLGTLIAPTSGSATVAGIPLTPENGVEIRQHISIMPEAPGLYLRLSVHENLEYFASLYGLSDAGPRIGAALEAVNLADRAKDLCGGLSKGLRQRVGLARTLLSDPTIMFLDEPTSGLDPVAAREVHELIIELRKKGVTIFITTHRLDEAEKLCDRVAIMNTTLRTIGRPAELRQRLFKSTLMVRTLTPLTDPDPVFAAVAAVETWRSEQPGSYVLSVSDPTAAAPDVTRALVAAGADVLSIGEVQHSLEDVYLELVDEDVEASAS